MKKTRFNAFTMAEILLSLTIIGVVAAITLPSLMGNINERTWNTQRKALHARMSQAIAMMPQLNGYGTFVADTVSAGSVTSSGTDTAAEAFLTEGLSKVIKINNICDYEHIEDCGIAPTMYAFDGGSVALSSILTIKNYNSYATPTYGINKETKPAAFETQNGESIILYYNPDCTSKQDSTVDYYTQSKICANFVYDLNGNKGPNTTGKDIGFITAYYATDPHVVAPVAGPAASSAYPLVATGETTTAGEFCTSQDSESRVPNLEEIASIIYNMKMFATNSAEEFVTSSTIFGADGKKVWLVEKNGSAFVQPATTASYLRCVKR